MNKIIGLGVFGTLLVLFGMYFATNISYSNEEINQRTSVYAQQDVCKAFQDKMWKTLQQKAQVSSQYKDAFKDIYVAVMDGRYKDGKNDALLRFVTESNPQFDVSLYKSLSDAIETQRQLFFEEQKKLIDMNREYTSYIQRQPQSWSIFLGKKPLIPIIIITSNTTKEVYETGEENDVNLFK